MTIVFEVPQKAHETIETNIQYFNFSIVILPQINDHKQLREESISEAVCLYINTTFILIGELPPRVY